MAGWTAAAIAASALISSNASKSAASTQAAAADRAAQLQKEQFDITRADQAPWREAGVNALGKLSSGNVMDYMDPGYQFRLNEGLKALGNNAKARGGLISGNALKAAQGYGQSMASQEYQNAFNRLGTLAGFGTSANAANAAAGQNYATNAGNMITGGAAANAAGGVGTANAVNSGVSQYLNYTSNNNLLNALQRNQSMQPVNTGGYSNVPAYMVQPNQ